MIQSIGIAKLGGSGGGGSAAANTMLSSELDSDLEIGNNTIAHSITGTILNIEIKDANNRKPDFSDFNWNNTDINIYSPIKYSSSDEIGQITFVISYTA